MTTTKQTKSIFNLKGSEGMQLPPDLEMAEGFTLLRMSYDEETFMPRLLENLDIVGWFPSLSLKYKKGKESPPTPQHQLNILVTGGQSYRNDMPGLKLGILCPDGRVYRDHYEANGTTVAYWRLQVAREILTFVSSIALKEDPFY